MSGMTETQILPEDANDSLKVRAALTDVLETLPDFDSCAIMDYPLFYNIGDHLIWSALTAWLLEVKKARIPYVAHAGSYTPRKLTAESQGPILFTGGGNLGDLWGYHQHFREKVIAAHPERPVVIMPQSIYFRDPAKLDRARRIFNAHPDLTLLARDEISYRFALGQFDRCRVLKAPDMSFYFADRLKLNDPFAGQQIFFHRRNDKELPANTRRGIPRVRNPGIVSGDWWSMNFASRGLQRLYRKCPFLSGLWQGPPVARLIELIPESQRACLEGLVREVGGLPYGGLHLKSLELVFRGVRQMAPYRLVITNRLHGHILCTLMGKPNILLANSYHKNQAFFETWTRGIRHACFSSSPSLCDVIGPPEASKEWPLYQAGLGTSETKLSTYFGMN
ncbi:MAG TPA: polysaccharide pyruvyl transferase family protein [Verrucomicrobiae bacterium]|jgi:pyruvyl transferase EpsO|nr:polysaccharide pyruvyl transferase family protein [Verrucomicrobiae bacterium]